MAEGCSWQLHRIALLCGVWRLRHQAWQMHSSLCTSAWEHGCTQLSLVALARGEPSLLQPLFTTLRIISYSSPFPSIIPSLLPPSSLQVENVSLLSQTRSNGFVGVNMYVDDEGSIKGLPRNLRATELAHCAGKPIEVRA